MSSYTDEFLKKCREIERHLDDIRFILDFGKKRMSGREKRDNIYYLISIRDKALEIKESLVREYMG